MHLVDSEELNNFLTPPQQVAKKIKSVAFQGWKCDENNIHLCRKVLDYRYKECPSCQELTVETTTETVAEATTAKRGLEIITDKCHCCDYQKQIEKILPRRFDNYGISDNYSQRFKSKKTKSKKSTITTKTKSSKSPRKSSYQNYDDEWESSNSSSFSGESFGGGASDGSGAGDDW